MKFESPKFQIKLLTCQKSLMYVVEKNEQFGTNKNRLEPIV